MESQLGCVQVLPRLFLHEFLKPREDIKESIEARRIFKYKCSTTIYTPKPFMPITFAHPYFILWWQELRDHIFNMPVHPLCLELMPDFQLTSEVNVHLPFFHLFLIILLPTNHDSVILQDTVPTPLARTILYEIEGPISTLGYRSPTLAQLMSSHATLDPPLITPVSDKRKASSGQNTFPS
jgi:hypothetical protein